MSRRVRSLDSDTLQKLNEVGSKFIKFSDGKAVIQVVPGCASSNIIMDVEAIIDWCDMRLESRKSHANKCVKGRGGGHSKRQIEHGDIIS